MKKIKHPGIIEKVTGDQIWVKVERHAGCGSCAAVSYCITSALRKESLRIKNNSRPWKVGQEVWVTLSFSWARRAVVLAYVMPVICLVLTLLLALATGMGELYAGLLSLLALVLYYGILYHLKDTFHRKVRFSITLKGTE